jgi:membrane protease YdiL (CAAX protease family)
VPPYSTRTAAGVKQSLKHFLVFLAWNLVISVILLFSVRPELSALQAGVGLALMLVVALAVINLYLLRSGFHDEEARAGELRLRPLRGESLRWVLLAAPVLLLFSWSLGEVYVRVVPVPPHALDPFSQLFVNPQGRLMLAILAIGIAPILEELFFRGLIQRALERRWGIVGGIAGASAFFALAHFMPWIFPLHLVLGAAFGFAVVATRSIWAGVLLHAANNAVALVGHGMERGEIPVIATVWEVGPHPELWVAILGLGASSGLGFWTGRRLWAAGRESRLREVGASG